VPVNMARTVMDQLIRSGHIDRGWIGVSGQDITPDLMAGLQTQHSEGAVISAIRPGSPADRAGLRIGDLVLSVDGVAITSWQHLLNRIALARINQELSLTVERQGRNITVPVKVAPQRNHEPSGPLENDDEP
jgi:serine protease Do